MPLTHQKLKMKTEHGEQAALIEWVQWNLGTHPQLHMLYAIPNGGPRDKATAAKLQAEGVRPGVPDLFLAYPARGFPGLYIEMKREDGKASAEQKAWARALLALGYHHSFCYSFESARDALVWYLDGDSPPLVEWPKFGD